MANKVKFGLKNVHYALATVDDDGSVTYGTPVPIRGAVNLSLDPEGSTDSFYADDGIYWTGASNSGYTGSLEIALVPDSFLVDVLGMVKTTDGMLAEYSDTEFKQFALLFEVSGDSAKTRFAYYLCSATRPSNAASTIEKTKTPQTESLSLTVAPRVDGLVKSRCYAKDAAYAEWFKSVKVPAAA